MALAEARCYCVLGTSSRRCRLRAAPMLLAAELLAMWTTRALAAPPLDVILRTRVSQVAGATLDTIDAPLARSADDLAFVGFSSAIVVSRPGGVSVVVTPGDPLPQPLTGRFTEVANPTVDDDGRVVFAGVGSDGTFGIFAWDGTSISLLPGTGLGAPHLNAAGDMAIGSASRIRFWDHAAQTMTVVVVARDNPILGPARTRLYGATVADTGLVAFAARPRDRNDVTGGVFAWTASSGVVPIARAQDRSPIDGRPWAVLRTQAVAVNAGGVVAFTAQPDGTPVGVFVWDPLTGTTVPVTPPLVNGVPLVRVRPEWIGIDDAGAVSFQASLGDGTTRLVLVTDAGATALTGPLPSTLTDFAPRLTNSRRIVWSVDRDVQAVDGAVVEAAGLPFPGFDLGNPDVNEEGTVVAEGRRSALFRLASGGPRMLYFAGGEVTGLGPILESSDARHSYSGAALVFGATFARAERYGTAIAADVGGRSIPLVRSGEPSPLGGVLEPSPYDVDDVVVVGNTALFVATSVDETVGTQVYGLFARNLANHRLKTLLRGDAPGTSRGPFEQFSLVGRVGRVPIVFAILPGYRVGLFAVIRGTAREIAVAEPPAFIEDALIDDGRLVFLRVEYDDAAQTRHGLFAWTPARDVAMLARVDVPVDDLGVTHPYGLAPGPHGTPILFARVPSETLYDTVALGVRRGRLRVLVRTGLQVAGGTSLRRFGSVTTWGNRIGFVGSAVDEAGGEHPGVFRLARGKVAPIVRDGATAVTGETLRHFDIVPGADSPILTAELEDFSTVVAVPRRPR